MERQAKLGWTAFGRLSILPLINPGRGPGSTPCGGARLVFERYFVWCLIHCDIHTIGCINRSMDLFLLYQHQSGKQQPSVPEAWLNLRVLMIMKISLFVWYLIIIVNNLITSATHCPAPSVRIGKSELIVYKRSPIFL